MNPDNLTEVTAHHFTTFASDLGWRAGHFPDQVETKMGNGQFLYPVAYKTEDGDLLYVTYRQNLGIMTVKVFND